MKEEFTPKGENSNSTKYIKSIVFGGLDGVITVFAVVAAVAGSGLPLEVCWWDGCVMGKKRGTTHGLEHKGGVGVGIRQFGWRRYFYGSGRLFE